MVACPGTSSPARSRPSTGGSAQEDRQPKWAQGSSSRFPSPARRAASPGGALLNVKARLHQFAQRQAGDAFCGRGAPAYDDADADKMLHARQTGRKVQGQLINAGRLHEF